MSCGIPFNSPCIPGGSCESTVKVCGQFDEPTNPDEGKCHPYRVKTDCERPDKPENPCNDDSAYAEYVPETESFVIVTKLHDENCDPILDENSDPILTTV